MKRSRGYRRLCLTEEIRCWGMKMMSRWGNNTERSGPSNVFVSTLKHRHRLGLYVDFRNCFWSYAITDIVVLTEKCPRGWTLEIRKSVENCDRCKNIFYMRQYEYFAFYVASPKPIIYCGTRSLVALSWMFTLTADQRDCSPGALPKSLRNQPT